MKPKHFPLIPIMANEIFLEGNERNLEEIGGRTQSWEICRREPGWVPCCGFCLGKKIMLGILEIPDDIWYLLKIKGGNY
jgi:hypothetical protein